MSETAARAAHVDKIKNQMMQVMGITDPAEFQRIAREYCKDAAAEMAMPYYLRIFTRIGKLLEKYRDKFNQLKSREEKVSLVLKTAMDDEETVDMFKAAFEEVDEDESKQLAGLSEEKRTAGNAAFSKKQDRQALQLYTEAIFAAPTSLEEGRREVAMGLANRSAVWFKLGKYEEALEDIEAALLFHYPENMRYKLAERQGKCYAALFQVEQAKLSFNRSLLLLKQSNLDSSKQASWAKEVKHQLDQLDKATENLTKKPTAQAQLVNKNKKIPQFSDAVELVYNSRVGRHGKATRNIEAGEVIMLDTSITCHLSPNNRKTHCAHCLKKINPEAGFPSTEGVASRFCSVACLKTAMGSYLPVEDKINLAKYLWNRKEKRYGEMSGNIFLTLRAITQKPLAFFEQYPDLDTVDAQWGVPGEGEGLEEECLYSDYRNLYNLEAHRTSKTKDELISLSIKTAVFIVLLRYGGYFGKKETPFASTASKQEALIGRVAFHFQEGIQYNLHTVDEALSSKLSGIAAPQVQEVGSAVFPTLLLLNHSCEPNTLRINTNGNQVLMVAKRRIKQGEEITDNYGIHHLSMTFEERQEALSRGFAFSCCCTACEKDFPRLKSLRSQLPEAVEDKFDAMREELKEVFRKGDHQACYRLSVDMIQLLEKQGVVYPHRHYELAGLCVLSCLWTLYGNKQ